MDRFEKQPYEAYTIATDFSRNLGVGESVVWQSVTATDNAGNDVTTQVTDQTTVANDGAARVTVLVRAGTEAGSPYHITFRCVTSVSHQWEHDIEMRVREQ